MSEPPLQAARRVCADGRSAVLGDVCALMAPLALRSGPYLAHVIVFAVLSLGVAGWLHNHCFPLFSLCFLLSVLHRIPLIDD